MPGLSAWPPGATAPRWTYCPGAVPRLPTDSAGWSPTMARAARRAAAPGPTLAPPPCPPPRRAAHHARPRPPDMPRPTRWADRGAPRRPTPPAPRPGSPRARVPAPRMLVPPCSGRSSVPPLRPGPARPSTARGLGHLCAGPLAAGLTQRPGRSARLRRWPAHRPTSPISALSRDRPVGAILGGLVRVWVVAFGR